MTSSEENLKKTEEGIPFSQIAQNASATILATAVISTACGVLWLVVSLPARLQHFEHQITQVLKNQDIFGTRFEKLEEKVDQQDRRIIKLELR
jgi:beta-lactamase regulating signal transducer with metallopeptidase domain